MAAGEEQRKPVVVVEQQPKCLQDKGIIALRIHCKERDKPLQVKVVPKAGHIKSCSAFRDVEAYLGCKVGPSNCTLGAWLGIRAKPLGGSSGGPTAAPSGPGTGPS